MLPTDTLTSSVASGGTINTGQGAIPCSSRSSPFGFVAAGHGGSVRQHTLRRRREVGCDNYFAQRNLRPSSSLAHVLPLLAGALAHAAAAGVGVMRLGGAFTLCVLLVHRLFLCFMHRALRMFRRRIDREQLQGFVTDVLDVVTRACGHEDDTVLFGRLHLAV
jgi:hypothetical protein